MNLPAAGAHPSGSVAAAGGGSRAWSLRTRLLVLVMALTLGAWVVGGVMAARAAHDAAERMRDQRLVQMSATVMAFARHELAESVGAAPAAGSEPERQQGVDLRYRYQVAHRGRVLMNSADAPAALPLAGSWSAGLSMRDQDRQRLRVFVSAPDADGLQVQVAELLDGEDVLFSWPGWTMLATMLLSLALVATAAVGLLMRVMKPVAAAEAALRQRPVQSLEPLPARGLPQEMQPLIEALNEHLARSALQLSRESGFTALAAHELRTPLAALRMQVQVATRLSDPAQRAQRLHALLDSVDRCSHLVEQLLTMARVEQESPQWLAVDLRARAERVIDELDGPRRARARAIVLDGEMLVVQGSDFALGVLLRNLLANAIDHGGSGEIRVGFAHAAGEAVLTIDDAGPGIAPQLRERACERFVRLPGGTGPGGVGLGLAIVRAVAEAHRAQLRLLDSPLGGLRVRVAFPAAAVPADNPARAP